MAIIIIIIIIFFSTYLSYMVRIMLLYKFILDLDQWQTSLAYTDIYRSLKCICGCYLSIRSSPDSPMEQELNAHDESDPVVPAETEASAVESWRRKAPPWTKCLKIVAFFCLFVWRH